MYDPELTTIIRQAVFRLQTDVRLRAPFMADQVSGWIDRLAGSGQPVDYFQHPLAFPALLLPWWLEERCCDRVDLRLQADLAYSTINGYYFIRLIDNLMDGHATVEMKLLPALAFFSTRFQDVYYHYFPVEHPFWDLFTNTWLRSGEAAMMDASFTDLDETRFEQVSAHKVCAAKIPLAAVSYYRNRPDLIEPWTHFVDDLGAWHQLLNDMLGWHRDLERGTATYFLGEAERGRAPGEPVAGWVARAGFDWAIEQLRRRMLRLKTLAGRLHSPNLLAYLATRETMLIRARDDARPGLQQLSRIIDGKLGLQN